MSPHPQEVVRRKPGRMFSLVRELDRRPTIVARGMEMPSGAVVLEWQTEPGSLGIFHNIREVKMIHGHGGTTRIEYDPSRTDQNILPDGTAAARPTETPARGQAVTDGGA